MIQRIIPQFFTSDLNRTIAYYERTLGFRCDYRYGDPPFYAGMSREEAPIFFRRLDVPPPHPPGKHESELLDAYITLAGIDSLQQELQQRGATFHRQLAAMPWGTREFVVRDCDGRLLCFGE